MATQITMVKKIKADGSPCNKCDQVTAKLEKEGHMSKITKFAYHVEGDDDAEGTLLAIKHDVATAPFFVVEDDESGATTVYEHYFQLKKEVLAGGGGGKKVDRAATKKAAADAALF